jgi:hypothetical protein
VVEGGMSAAITPACALVFATSGASISALRDIVTLHEAINWQHDGSPGVLHGVSSFVSCAE